MVTSDKLFADLYGQFQHWLSDVNKHEITSLVELVELAKQYAIAAESLPQERVTQFLSNLKYDLSEFTSQLEDDAQKSLYLGVLKEGWWQYVADLADQTQIEWAELPDDFSHDGVYKQGDFIGFGKLVCSQCENKITVCHFSEVMPCTQCGHIEFKRLPLSGSD